MHTKNAGAVLFEEDVAKEFALNGWWKNKADLENAELRRIVERKIYTSSRESKNFRVCGENEIKLGSDEYHGYLRGDVLYWTNDDKGMWDGE